jgi:hypothetical protein
MIQNGTVRLPPNLSVFALGGIAADETEIL